MEEYNYKLTQNNPILTLNAITGLVNKVRGLQKSSNQTEISKYYKYLREHCINGSNSVASTAMLGLIELTKGHDPIITLAYLVKDMMSTVSNIKNLSGLIDLIFYALFELNRMSFDIMKNQHPLITILKRNQSCWPLILCRIEDKFRSESKVKVLQRLQPFALFVLYDYERKMDPLLQLEMLQIYKQYLDNSTRQKIILLNLTHISRSIRYCKVLLSEVPAMATYIIRAIHILLSNDQDATEPVWILHQYLIVSAFRDYSLEIAMTADCISIAPVMYMITLCECVDIMLSTQKYSTLVTSILKSSLCCWKMHYSIASVIDSKVSSKVDELLMRQFEHNDVEYTDFDFLDEKQVIYSYMIYNDLSMDFLNNLDESSPHILEKLSNILLGILYDDNDVEITMKVLDLCLKCCEEQPRFTTRMTPVVLYKLAHALHPNVQLKLLRVLPKMGVLKENLTTIVMTIKAISAVSTQMHAFALTLLYELVRVDKICFPYLEELLIKECEDGKSDGARQLAIAKAFVVMELCHHIEAASLENYRKELATYVSQVLVKANDNNIAVAFAFEALKYLCQGIDPYSTWLNLSQRYVNDSREGVIVGMCGIAGEIAAIPELQDQKCEKIIRSIFVQVQNSTSPAILEAAYKALTNFSMEQISLGFPSAFASDYSVLGSIAGTSWINVLLMAPRAGLRAAADMLIHFIHADMRTYKRNVYEVVDGHGEPLYMALTRDNVLAAVAKYVKKSSSSLATVDREVYLECLRILSVKYKRPLPPMEWSFLMELTDQKDMLAYCLDIAAHQSSVSGSARRIVENYIKLISERQTLSEEVMHVYRNLDYLANTIQPSLMKPFFKRTLRIGLAMMQQSSKEVDFILGKIQEILRNSVVLESNKIAAADVLMFIIDEYDMDTDVFRKIEPAVASVPPQYLNEYCPVHYESLNDKILMKCLSIRCATAYGEKAKPFVLLDSIIDCRAMKSNVQASFNFQQIFIKLTPIFRKHWNHPMLAPWLHELTAKIELELADRKDMRCVIFSCTILVIAAVVSSGYDTFNTGAANLEEFIEIFPFAMASLLNRKAFAPHVSQFLETMHDIATNTGYKRNLLSELFTGKFKHALLLMRSHEIFNDKLCWMKYIEVN